MAYADVICPIIHGFTNRVLLVAVIVFRFALVGHYLAIVATIARLAVACVVARAAF